MKTYTIIANHRIITTEATEWEAMDAVFDLNLNADENNPVQIFDNETGREIEW